MGQNLAGMTATGTFADTTTSDITSQVAWTVSDTTIVTIGAATGLLTIQAAGEIWGGDVGVTATLAPGTPGTASLLVISSDSGSVAPRMPQQDNHWQALGLSPWNAYFGCQEPSGSNLVGSGSAGYTLTANAGAGQGVIYGNGVSPWTRVGVMMTGTSNTRISAASGTGPNPNATSVAWLGYIQLGFPLTPNIGFFGVIAGVNANVVAVTTTSNANAGSIATLSNFGGHNAVGPVTHRHDDRVHPILLIYNRTTNEMWLASDVAIAMSGGQPGVNDDTKGFGCRSGGTAISQSMVWMATGTGSIVERLCSTSASADFLSRLGWNVTWKNCPTESGTIKLPFLPDHFTSLGIQPWTATWNLQDPGSPARSFDRWVSKDDNGWSLVQGTTISYERQIANTAGWTRKSVMVTQAAGQNMKRLDVIGPPAQFDPTGSFAILAYAAVSGGASDTQLFGLGNSTTPSTQVVVNMRAAVGSYQPVLYCAGATVTGTTGLTDLKVHPHLLVYDKTNSRVKYYNDNEKVTGTFGALSLVNSITSSIGFGSTAAGALVGASGNYTYFVFTTGTQAENLSDDAQASSFLKTLGWTIPW